LDLGCITIRSKGGDMINIEEVLLSIIITAVIVTAILYYYSAKFDSHDIDIQILESNRKFDDTTH
jgi:cell division protein FtsL